MNGLRKARYLFLAPLVFVAALALACGDDDDDAVNEHSEDEIVAGVVSDKPDDATQVDIVLSEWAVQTSEQTVAAGKIYFLVENTGPTDPHEFVIIRSDAGPLDLPYEDDRVPEDQIDLVDEIEPFSPASSASIVVDLTPGRYLLICNITEVEDGEIESHYKLGMVAILTVE